MKFMVERALAYITSLVLFRVQYYIADMAIIIIIIIIMRMMTADSIYRYIYYLNGHSATYEVNM
jgi:hypothetical protein